MPRRAAVLTVLLCAAASLSGRQAIGLQALAESCQQGCARPLSILGDSPRRHPRFPFNSQVPFEYGERSLLLAGAALEKLGEWDRASQPYRRLLEGGAALAEGAGAFSSFTRVLVGHPDSALSPEALQAVSDFRSRFPGSDLGEQALAWFQRLEGWPKNIRLPADRAQGWYYQGRALYKLERLDEAEQSFARAASAESLQREEALYWAGVAASRRRNT